MTKVIVRFHPDAEAEYLKAKSDTCTEGGKKRPGFKSTPSTPRSTESTTRQFCQLCKPRPATNRLRFSKSVGVCS